jgi:hypothetical protein
MCSNTTADSKNASSAQFDRVQGSHDSFMVNGVAWNANGHVITQYRAAAGMPAVEYRKARHLRKFLAGAEAMRRMSYSAIVFLAFVQRCLLHVIELLAVRMHDNKKTPKYQLLGQA